MYSIADIKKVFTAKGYRFFEQGKYNLNIIGIRSECSVSNEFDDQLLLIYKDDRNVQCFNIYPITTDPGKTWLLNPLQDTNGALIMVPGQYRDVYALGIHGRSRPKARQYEALEQVGDICYVRDNNKDSVIDTSLYRTIMPKYIEGNFKTNIHRGNPGWLRKVTGLHLVDAYSAGCQVFEYRDDFDEFMEIVKKAFAIWKGRFTYTLLEERDFSRLTSPGK